MSFAMSAGEREQFLAGLHVGVLSVAVNGAGEAAGSRAPLAVPVWYDYQPVFFALMQRLLSCLHPL